jgi:GntR family transcriptional regulator/MocR family aminotransferase
MREPINLEPLFPDRVSGEPLGGQFLRRLRDTIRSGFFPPGSRLLPSRELAKRLGVARNTVTSAFEQLIAEGYLEARLGSGTYVTATLQDTQESRVPSRQSLPATPGRLAPVKDALEIVGSSFGALRVGAPDLSTFPIVTWQRLHRRHLARARSDLEYAEPSGLLALREAISRHIAQFRGVVAGSDRVIVVEGAQAALHLTAFVVAQGGQRVAIEDPCYQNARAIFSAHGLALHGIAVDDDGMRTSDLPDGAALAYVTPSHQFPLGGSMTLARRAQLLEWARRTNAYVVEDDYDSEFDSHPLPALQSLDSNERVIYVGTFSKTLAPRLRLGYVVAPPHLAEMFRFTRAITSLGASAHLQAVVSDFIAQGHFSRHVRRMTGVYERRRRIVLDVFARELPIGFRVGPAQTGLHVAVIGPIHFDDVGVANSLINGLRVLPISTQCVQRTDCKGLLLGFSAGTDDEIASAARTLAAAIRATQRPSEPGIIGR